MKEKIKFYSDASFWILLGANIFAIFIAFIENWSLAEIMWMYWGQSIAIGIVNVIRLVRLKDYSADNLKINKTPAVKTPFLKYFMAGFFCVHYGFFHLVYALFLFSFDLMANFNSILFGVGIFFVDHAFSYFYNESRDLEKKRNIGTIMFFPYFRIWPMHLTIILLGGLDFLSRQIFNENIFALFFFLFLKTIADLGMHVVEHNYSKPRPFITSFLVKGIKSE